MSATRLAYDMTGPFTLSRVADSPEVDEAAPGLRLVASNVTHADDALSFDLLLCYGFGDAFFFAFKDVQKAIVLELEDPSAGRATSFALLDPSVNYLPDPAPNFAPPPPGSPSAAFLRAFVGVPLRVPSPRGASLYARAVLHGHRSNVVRIAVDA